MAHSIVDTTPRLDLLKRALERCRVDISRRAIGFITQDAFNDIIRHGNVYEIALAVEKYKEMVVGFDSKGMSPLMCVASRDETNLQELNVIVELLIRRGAKMDAGRYSSTTPLCYAATKSSRVLQVFIHYETNWTLYQHFDEKPWQIALRTSAENFLLLLPYITSAGYDATGSTLLIDVVKIHPELTPIVLTRQIFRDVVNLPDANGETPLSHAARVNYNRHIVTRPLLRHGASILFRREARIIYCIEGYQYDTPDVDYIRRRIRHCRDNTVFDVRHDRWYERVAI